MCQCLYFSKIVVVELVYCYCLSICYDFVKILLRSNYAKIGEREDLGRILSRFWYAKIEVREDLSTIFLRFGYAKIRVMEDLGTISHDLGRRYA
jgi:hypothetical protein